MSVKSYEVPDEDKDYGAPDEHPLFEDEELVVGQDDERVPPKCSIDDDAHQSCSHKRQRELDEDDDALTLKQKKEVAIRKLRRLLDKQERELDELISMPQKERKQHDGDTLSIKHIDELKTELTQILEQTPSLKHV